MEKARRLAGESGTMNMPVTVWSRNDRLGKAAGSYLVGLLNDLGYRARLHAVSSNQFWTDIYNPRLTIQVSIGVGWGADYPAPSTFFGPLLSCQSADEPGTQNLARFCDPHVDALARQAQAVQLTDPAAARRLWAQADHIVTDQAPYVPVLNVGTAGFVSSRAGNYKNRRYTDRWSTRCGSGKTQPACRRPTAAFSIVGSSSSTAFAAGPSGMKLSSLVTRLIRPS
jgi:peptide/nickel transport system substrate-binding protein